MFDSSARPWLAYGAGETNEQLEARAIAAGCHMVRLPARIEPAVKIPSETFPLDVNGVLPGAAFNPSLTRSGDDVIVNVRSVERGVARNVLGVLDGKKLYSRTVVIGGDGLEDIRLFSLGGALWGIASVGPRPAQVVFRFEGNRVVAKDVLSSPRQERNWMPAVVQEDGQATAQAVGASAEERLRLVYTTQPLAVLDYIPLKDRKTARGRPEPLSPRVEEIVQTIGHVRGGSQLLPWQDGWIAVVHQAHKRPPGAAYVHRFVRFNRDLTEARMGKAFFFVEEGVEFCAGMVEQDGKFLLSFGVGDRRALVAQVSAAVVEQFAVEAPPDWIEPAVAADATKKEG